MLINSAYQPDSTSTLGWEPGYGWGMIDVHRAALHAANDNYFEHTVLSNATSNSNDDRKYYSGSLLPADSTENHHDKATLVWNRHVNWSYGETPDTATALSNLDLILYDYSNGSEIMASRSTIDNVEQVYWDSTTDTLATALLVVDSESTHAAGFNEEAFSLATEDGFALVADEDPIKMSITQFTTVGTPTVGVDYKVQLAVWMQGIALCDTVFPNLGIVDANTTISSGPTPPFAAPFQGTYAGFTYMLNSTTAGPKTIYITATSTCYDKLWLKTATHNYTVAAAKTTGVSPSAIDGPFALTGVTQSTGHTTFHYSAPTPTTISLEIHDLRGRRIYSQLSRPVAAGQGRLDWRNQDNSGAVVAQGVYFARFVGAGIETRRKLLVLR